MMREIYETEKRIKKIIKKFFVNILFFIFGIILSITLYSLTFSKDESKCDNIFEFVDIKNSPYIEMEVEATAYANVEECCAPYFDGKTAIGRDANKWGVAVDPNLIPYRSIVEVVGYGKLIADDCGGSIKGKKIDIRFPNGDIESAKRWGRRMVKIRVYVK